MHPETIINCIAMNEVTVTRDHSLWLTISLWPSFAISQLNVFKTISFDSIHYLSMIF